MGADPPATDYNSLSSPPPIMLNGTIATAFDDLTTFQLMEWLDEGNPTAKEQRVILRELASRQQRLEAIADLLW